MASRSATVCRCCRLLRLMIYSRLNFLSILSLVTSGAYGFSVTKNLTLQSRSDSAVGPLGNLEVNSSILGGNSPVSNDDFIALEKRIKEFIAQNPDRHIPLLVRNLFHDLFLQNQAGYHGCIMKPEFVSNLENAGLAAINQDLKNIIATHFAETGFSMGDVTAFAGKVAVEAAYPCVDIPFKFNRSPCIQEDPITANEAPSAFINSIKGLNRMLKYLGTSITPEDIAILFAGAHGIKGATAGSSGWFGMFSNVTSGKEFILNTFSSVWKGTSQGTLFQFFKGDTFDPQSSIIRLPTDMIFYPSKVPAGAIKDNSAEAKTIENTLKGFLNQDSSVFDDRFAQAITKLLAIGDGDQLFVPNSKSDQCLTEDNPIGGLVFSDVTTTADSPRTASSSPTTTTTISTKVSSFALTADESSEFGLTAKKSSSKIASTITKVDESFSTTDAESSLITIDISKASTTEANSSTGSAGITTTGSAGITTTGSAASTTTGSAASTTTGSMEIASSLMSECPQGYSDCVLSGSIILFPYIELMAVLLLLL